MKRDYEIRLDREVPGELLRLFKIWFWDKEIEEKVENKIFSLVDKLGRYGYSADSVRFEVEIVPKGCFWDYVEGEEMKALTEEGAKLGMFEVNVVYYTPNVWGRYRVTEVDKWFFMMEHGNTRNSAIYEFIVQYREYLKSKQ